MTAFPKPLPRVLEKRHKQREEEIFKRSVFAEVDARDGYRCRACGKPADPRATSALKRGHRHHLKFRSRGGQDTTANILLLCAICHARVHFRDLLIIGYDANKQLKFRWVKR